MFLLQIKDVWNLAGVISFSRLIIAVIFPFCMYSWSMSIVLILLAGISDVLDGAIARWQQTTSHTGAFLDGWVDKIFVINVVWSLVLLEYLDPWMGLLLFSREWVQIPMVPYYVRQYMQGKHPQNEPILWGKITSFCIFVTMLAGLFGFDALCLYMSIIAGICGLCTTGVYFLREFELFDKFRYKY